MGSVNIAIKDEAYNFLKSLKKEDDSFSDVILTFKHKNKNDGKSLLIFVERYKHLLEEIDWTHSEKNLSYFRASLNKRLAKNIESIDEVSSDK